LEESLLTTEELIVWLGAWAMLEVWAMGNIVIWERTPSEVLILCHRMIAFSPADPL